MAQLLMEGETQVTSWPVWKPERRRCFFLHAPKTAGMTMRQALARQYGQSDLFPVETWDALPRLERPIDAYRLFAGHFRGWFRRFLPADTLCVTILRDPVERSLSHLRHLLADPTFHALHGSVQGRSIEQVLDDPAITSQVTNIQVGYLSAPSDNFSDDFAVARGFSEAALVGDIDLDAALKTLDGVEYVLFAEDLAEDFAWFCDEAGLHPPGQFFVTNSARENARDKPVSDGVRERLKELNRLDDALYAAARRQRAGRPALAPRRQRVAKLFAAGTYPAIGEGCDFAMGNPVPAAGLWFAEGEAPNVYRWTGPDHPLIELQLDSAYDYIVELALSAPLGSGAFCVLVDDRPVETALVAFAYQTATVRFTVVPDAAHPVTQIALCCGRVQRPPGDNRALGLVLSRMSIRRNAAR